MILTLVNRVLHGFYSQSVKVLCLQYYVVNYLEFNSEILQSTVSIIEKYMVCLVFTYCGDKALDVHI